MLALRLAEQLLTSKDSDCPGCKKRNVIIIAQRREIERLQKIIKAGQIEASSIIRQADDIMSEHQPRGKWSFAKGAKRSAQAILNKLR